MRKGFCLCWNLRSQLLRHKKYMSFNLKEIISFYLNHYGYVDLIAHGESMFPTIKDGDQVRIIPQENYNENDIIAFWNSHNKIVIHRIIITKKNKFFTKGDNNKEFDKIVSKKDILGLALKNNH